MGEQAISRFSSNPNASGLSGGVEAAIRMYYVDTSNEALRFAIAKTGDMHNPDLSYVEISSGSRTSPTGEALSLTFVAADGALVAPKLEMAVFTGEDEVHAAQITRKEIGQ